MIFPEMPHDCIRAGRAAFTNGFDDLPITPTRKTAAMASDNKKKMYGCKIKTFHTRKLGNIKTNQLCKRESLSIDNVL